VNHAKKLNKKSFVQHKINVSIEICIAKVLHYFYLYTQWRIKGNISAPSYFIANAHNKLYAFYTGKGD